MCEQLIHAFPLVDQYMGIRMDINLSTLKPGRVEAVESPRRLRKEESYGFIHALWWIWLEDGRSVMSVPPGAGDAVAKILNDVRCSEQLLESGIAEQLKVPVNDSLRKAGLKEVDRVLRDVCFACNTSLLRRYKHGECQRLVDESILPAEGLRLPTHCFPRWNCLWSSGRRQSRIGSVRSSQWCYGRTGR